MSEGNKCYGEKQSREKCNGMSGAEMWVNEMDFLQGSEGRPHSEGDI